MSLSWHVAKSLVCCWSFSFLNHAFRLLWLLLYSIDVLYILDEFYFIYLFLIWHAFWDYFMDKYMSNSLTWLLCIISSYFTSLFFILHLIICKMRPYLWYYIHYSFIKLIPLVLWKHFICYQAMLPLSLIYLIS